MAPYKAPEVLESEIEEAFNTLSIEEKARLDEWAGLQAFIIAETGIEEEVWWEYLETAFANIGDYSFLGFARRAKDGDVLGADDRREKSLAALGKKETTKLPGMGGGIGNLLGMVASGKKDRGK